MFALYSRCRIKSYLFWLFFLHFSVLIHGSQSDGGNIAICHFGGLPRPKKGGSYTFQQGLHIWSGSVAQYFQNNVLSIALAAGYQVDVYNHMWSRREWNNSFIERKLSSAFKERLPLVRHVHTIVQNYEDTQWQRWTMEGIPMLQSIEAGLRYMQSRARRLLHNSQEYHFVLILRYDAIIRTPFQLDALNPKLFYVANWCSASGLGGHIKSSGKGKFPNRFCSPLHRWWADQEGIPDFYFASSPLLVNYVFSGIVNDFIGRKFVTAGESTAHGIIRGRLQRYDSSCTIFLPLSLLFSYAFS